MGTLNVNRSVADAFYRYKMPRICAKVEGKGNGIKTVIVNMVEVAKAIGRPPTYPTKYFGCELGAQTQFDFKNERYIVNGSHDSAKLQDLLDGFIRKFVLCPECDNPETELLVSTKRNTISQGCKACGYHGQLEFNHKLNTFILKNPPSADPATQGASLTEGGRKRSKRSNPSANTPANGHEHAEGEGAGTGAGGEETESAKGEEKREKKKEKKQAEDDDDEWTVDVSEEAVRARMHDLTDSAKCMTLSEDTEKNEKQRMDLFYAFLKQRMASGQVHTARANTEIVHEAERLEVKARAPLVVVELGVREPSVPADLRRARALLLRLTHDDPRAQRMLLHGIERLTHDHPALLPKLPAILHLLYELDLVEERGVSEWVSKPSRKYAERDAAADIRRRAQPFLDWLHTADEESDRDEDTDHEDIEIEYSDRAGRGTQQQKPVAAAAKQHKPDDEEDNDLDIDAI